MEKINQITMHLLNEISDISKISENYAYNIRQDGQCASRKNTENIEIVSKTDKDGININIKPNTKNEKVYIPACITKSNVNDIVYNDFYVGENSDVTIIAGCGVHTDGDEESQHNGIHRFFLEPNSKVLYVEKHYGEGEYNSKAKRFINPVTEVYLKENSYLEMDTVQIKGVDSTIRKTKGELLSNAKLVIKEKIMTHGKQYAETDFVVDLNGENSGVDLVSRSVARDKSNQVFRSRVNGNCKCYGHSSCDAIIMDNSSVSAIPELTANNIDAQLIHEAAIGKIAGEQLTKLMTLGLTEQEAEDTIVNGFLK